VKWIVIIGTLQSGLERAVGPFTSEDDAITYGQDQVDAAPDEVKDWAVVLYEEMEDAA
jgi:hypothetical protein